MEKLTTLLLLVFLIACSNEDGGKPQTINMRVNHYQNTGMAVGPVLTLLVQQGNDIGTDTWTKFYAPIEGFDYIPGRIYDLSVRTEPIANPPADGSSVKYTLQEVRSFQDVSDETMFTIDLKINGQSFITTTSGYELLDQIEIDCNSLCDELDEKLQHQDFVVGTFKRVQDSKIELTELE